MLPTSTQNGAPSLMLREIIRSAFKDIASRAATTWESLEANLAEMLKARVAAGGGSKAVGWPRSPRTSRRAPNRGRAVGSTCPRPTPTMSFVFVSRMVQPS